MDEVHYSSDRQDWGTPLDFFMVLSVMYGPFTLDPCALPVNAKERQVNPFELEGSKGEVMLAEHLHLAGLPPGEREYRFAAHAVGLGPGIRARLREAGLKDWRFDFAWPDRMLAVEVQGATWSQGRHTRGKGYEDDREKINAAQLMGWTVLEFTTEMIRDGRALRTIEQALQAITQKD